MAVAVKTLRHDERISLVDHLDELRTRDHRLRRCLGRGIRRVLLAEPRTPEADQPAAGHADPEAGPRRTRAARRCLHQPAEHPERSPSSSPRRCRRYRARRAISARPPARSCATSTRAFTDTIAQLNKPPTGDKPVTLGIGEPFTTTVGVTLLFALILSLPVILYELYAFIIPALSPTQKRAARPTLMAIPGLFIAGIAFGYLVVLPAAVHFFENFNSSQFNVLVQASQYYHFAAMTILAMGLLFQVPVAILAATRATSSRRATAQDPSLRDSCLRCDRRAVPGDVTTMLLETVPLRLFEASLIIATLTQRRRRPAV